MLAALTHSLGQPVAGVEDVSAAMRMTSEFPPPFYQAPQIFKGICRTSIPLVKIFMNPLRRSRSVFKETDSSIHHSQISHTTFHEGGDGAFYYSICPHTFFPCQKY